jgi:ubiquitin fusion degradation protein 1
LCCCGCPRRELQADLGRGGTLVFELKNEVIGRSIFCGVLEFSGEERGVAYLPLWIMHNLAVEDGSQVSFRLRSLPTISYLRLQPTDSSFTTVVADPKAALEAELCNFTAVTEGQELVVHHGDRAFSFHVLEIKPENALHAACLIGADVTLDFEAPPECECAF